MSEPNLYVEAWTAATSRSEEFRADSASRSIRLDEFGEQLSFTALAESSTVLPAADQQRVAQRLEDDAEVMANTQLEQLVATQPQEIRDEALG
jgi:hypothetical protein